MSIERARTSLHPKPWGVTDLRPWSDAGDGSARIGELSYERSDPTAPAASLLLKLLFTSEPLSIQVHPDDAYAHSVGLPNGKSEAWFVLAATVGAEVGLGLKVAMTKEQLREVVADGSIASLINWQSVKADDVIMVPAGTIHAIGAGLVIAEIQQRSDATYRMFDHGRARALDVDNAIAVAMRNPPDAQSRVRRISPERTLLAESPHFVLERVTLAPGSRWCFDAARETWLVVLDGAASVGPYDLVRGDATFAKGERVDVSVGRNGLECLVAYTGAGGSLPELLQRFAQDGAGDVNRSRCPAAPEIQIGAGS